MSDCTYNVYSLKPFGFFIAKFSGEVTMRDLGKAHDVMTETSFGTCDLVSVDAEMKVSRYHSLPRSFLGSD